MDAELRQSSKYAMAVKRREKAVKKELVAVKEELVESRKEFENVRWGHNEMGMQRNQAEVDVNGVLRTVLTSLAVLCGHMCFSVQGKLNIAFWKIWTHFGWRRNE